jgi:hypothetical protein
VSAKTAPATRANITEIAMIFFIQSPPKDWRTGSGFYAVFPVPDCRN